MLSEFSAFVSPVPGVAVIALQYVDEFFITGAMDEFRSSILFSLENKRLPAAIIEDTDFWHNHAGWFELSPKGDRVLNNLNISYYPQQHDRNAVQIISAHKEILKTPVTEHDGLVVLLPDSFEMLHSMNKAMFKEILNKETLKSINLS